MTTPRATGVAKRKQTAVAQAAFQALYDAAGNGRRIKSWNPKSTGPQSVLKGHDKIRNRARDVVRNDWAGESGVQKWTTALIGVGIVPRWKDKTIGEEWKLQVKTCDADGVLDAYSMQALAVRAWASSGEVFLRRRWRDPSLVDRGYMAAPVQYQLIESDFCPIFDAEQWIGMPKGNTIRQGIEFNRFGRRVAYWMYPEHPGDKSLGLPSLPTGLIRIPAADIKHVFEPLRPGQLRGVSPLANILVRLRNSADFEDAVLDRQKLGNLFVAFIKRTIPAGAQIEYDAVTGLPTFYSKTGEPLASLEPGMFQELMPGEEMQFANPPEPGTSFPEYMKTTHRGTAAGLGLPYELHTGDIQDVSDRTLRVVINEFRRYCEQRQWHLAIPSVCQPMVDWWAEAMALTSWSADRVAQAKACTWHPHGWEYIHPVQDVEGKAKAIEAGLTSRSAEILKRGEDPEEVDEQRRVDREREEDFDLLPQPGEPGGPPAPAPQPQPQVDDRMLQILTAFSQTSERMQGLFVDAMRGQQQPVPVQPTVGAEQIAQIAATAAAAAVQPMAEMFAKAIEAIAAVAARPATPVTVQNNVEPTPLNVAVQAPSVAITNNVPPAEVSVSLPNRERVTEVEYDEATGEIIKSTTIEKSILQ